MIRVNLLGLPRARAKRRAHVPVVTVGGRLALILVVVVLVGVAAVQYWRYSGLLSEIARLDHEIEQLQREKADLGRLKAEYDTNMQRREQLTHRINVIEELKARQSGPAQLLNVLATVVSQAGSVWLTSFEQKGRNITIEGVALNVKAVADLLTRMKGSDLFSNVDLKEAAQDASVKDFTSFDFTLTGELAAPALTTATQPGSV